MISDKFGLFLLSCFCQWRIQRDQKDNVKNVRMLQHFVEGEESIEESIARFLLFDRRKFGQMIDLNKIFSLNCD